MRAVADQYGSQTFTITANDGQAANNTVTRTFDLTVNPVNDAPQFTSTAVAGGTQGLTYSYAIQTMDIETSDVLSITAATKPSWLTIADNGDGTATLSGTPGNAQVGAHNVVLNVSDGEASTEQIFTITVDNVNDAPTISEIAKQTIGASKQSRPIEFTVGDIDNDVTNLTISTQSSNQTLVTNANIVVSGVGADRTIKIVPNSGQLGTTTITLTVSDGTDTTSITFTLEVTRTHMYFPLMFTAPSTDVETFSTSTNERTR
jgi:hypothetical protein